MIDQRIALPILFYGWWSPSTQYLTSEEEKSADSVRIIEMVLEVLMMSSEKYSLFLKMMLDYIGCLNKTARFTFPYIDIQDSISLNINLAEKISKQLRSND